MKINTCDRITHTIDFNDGTKIVMDKRPRENVIRFMAYINDQYVHRSRNKDLYQTFNALNKALTQI